MIIEFIGSTGAGKTTLISKVQRRLSEPTQAVTSYDLVAGMFGFRHVINPTIQNLIQDLVCLPYFIRSLYQYREFVVYALKILVRYSGYTFFTLNYLRSILRKIGLYQIIKRYENNRIILVDEGTVLSAHLLFVYTHTIYSQKDIETFATLVPLPELVICIRVPLDNLVQRSIYRNDVRRELKMKNPKVVEKYIDRTTEMFEELVKTKEIRDRVLIVSNPESTDEERNLLADSIAQFILDYDLECKRFALSPRERIRPIGVNYEKNAS